MIIVWVIPKPGAGRQVSGHVAGGGEVCTNASLLGVTASATAFLLDLTKCFKNCVDVTFVGQSR
jgi:hypothetical protein